MGSENIFQILAINLMLGFLVLTVSLKISFNSLIKASKDFKSIGIGIFSQIILLPLLTFIVANIFKLPGDLAIGFFIIGACSGGSLSNIFSDLANGDIEYSILLTSFSSIVGPFTIPFNFLLWSSLYPPSQEILKRLNLNVLQMYLNIFLILGIPLFLGVYLRTKKPAIADQIFSWVRKLAFLSLAIILMGMFVKYYKVALPTVKTVLPFTFTHNILAMLLGFSMGMFLTKKKRKTLAIEVGIQNSGLGAALIFQFFPNLEMALAVCFWWSIIHMLNAGIFVQITRKLKL